MITGGAGFIGSNLADRLLRLGHSVTVFDDLSRPGAELNLEWLRGEHADGLQFVRADVRSSEAVAQALGGAEVIYHLAGQTAVTTSVSDPRSDFEVNALGTLNVLEAARHSHEDPIVVYASTNKVYGALPSAEVVEQATRYAFSNRPQGVNEEQPLLFDSPYACSKGVADQYALAYFNLYGLRTVVLRQSCVYGPRQMGFEDQGWVAWFLVAARLGRNICVFGDGKQVRDLLYVEDLLDAYEAVVTRIDRTQGRVYNLGGGGAMTLSVWVEFEPLLAEVLGRAPGTPTFADWRPGDQRVFYCDVERARRDLDWQPRVVPREGIARLAGWVRAHEPLLVRVIDR
jgi:CDP-paratose 2-epimerase